MTTYTTFNPFNQWHSLYLKSILSRITSGVRSSPFTVSPSHHLLTSFTESGEVFRPIPGAISDLSGPILDCDDDPESDLIDLWSWLPTLPLRLTRVSLLFSRRHLQRVPLVDPTAVSKSAAACAMAFQRQRVLHNPRLRIGLYLFMPIIMSMILNISTFQFLNTVVQNQHASLQEFSERFKYDVISSPLLSSSVTAPSSTRRRSSPSPGDTPNDDPESTSHPPPPPSPPVIYRSPALLLLFCLCLYLDYFMLYVLIAIVLYSSESYTIASGPLPDFIPPVGAIYFYPTLC